MKGESKMCPLCATRMVQEVVGRQSQRGMVIRGIAHSQMTRLLHRGGGAFVGPVA